MKKLLLFIGICMISATAYPFWVWSPKNQTWKNPKNSSLSTPSLQAAKAQSYFIAEKYSEAYKEYKKILISYPDSKEAADAQYFLGRCLEKQNKQYEAFNEYQKVIDTYPNSQKIVEIVERQFKIGEYFLNRDYKKILGLGKYDFIEHPSVEIFNKIVEKSSFSIFAPHAQYDLGLLYLGLNRFEEARDAFQKLLDTYPENEWATPAKYQLAIATAKASSGVDYDSTAIKEAVVRLDEFIKDHPQVQIAPAAMLQLDELKEKEAKKNFDIAVFYEKQGQFKAARSYFKSIIERYGNTALRDVIDKHLANLDKLLNQNIASKQDLAKKKKQELKERQTQAKLQIQNRRCELAQKIASAKLNRSREKEQKRSQNKQRCLRIAEERLKIKEQKLIKRREREIAIATEKLLKHRQQEQTYKEESVNIN